MLYKEINANQEFRICSKRDLNYFMEAVKEYSVVNDLEEYMLFPMSHRELWQEFEKDLTRWYMHKQDCCYDECMVSHEGIAHAMLMGCISSDEKKLAFVLDALEWKKKAC